jgi:hypothetical protein
MTLVDETMRFAGERGRRVHALRFAPLDGGLRFIRGYNRSSLPGWKIRDALSRCVFADEFCELLSAVFVILEPVEAGAAGGEEDVVVGG